MNSKNAVLAKKARLRAKVTAGFSFRSLLKMKMMIDPVLIRYSQKMVKYTQILPRKKS